MPASKSFFEIDSVTQWIDCLRNGDGRSCEDAAQSIWERYCRRLIGLVRVRLRSTSRRFADESDVVQQALQNFFLSVKEDKFPRLEDGEDLWKLLVTIADNVRKQERRDQGSLMRGRGQETGDSALGWHKNEAIGNGFDQLPDLASPTAEFADHIISTAEELFVGLTDEQMNIVLFKYAGFTNEEISDKLDRSVATVERRLTQIREAWLQDQQ